MGHSIAYRVAEPIAPPARALAAASNTATAPGLRLVPHDPIAPARSRHGGLAPWQVSRLSSYIAANLERKTRIADLADVARLSVSHFAHAFRASFDTSPAALIRDRRLDRARHLLLTSNLSLAEIALECGFADQAHMTRLFRRQTDMPPGKWREGMQGEKIAQISARVMIKR